MLKIVVRYKRQAQSPSGPIAVLRTDQPSFSLSRNSTHLSITLGPIVPLSGKPLLIIRSKSANYHITLSNEWVETVLLVS